MAEQGWTTAPHPARHGHGPLVASRMMVLLGWSETNERKRESLQYIVYLLLLIFSFAYLIYLTANASIHF